jgi:hypothetical protein
MTNNLSKARPRSKKVALASLEDIKFENEFFEYNPDNDPTGGIGINLIDRALDRAKIAGISVYEWTTIHKLYYEMRQNQKKSYLNR